MHTLVLVNLGACCLIAFSTLWLVTDQSKGRLVRFCLALIMCGAMVNVLALWTAFNRVHASHPVTWPTEAVLNLGEAMLLACWALERRRHLPFMK
ncbi:hypothetical protein [Luteibacter yeojuensis]|uniref:Uncharacterized protein n=1 Tax=Luteibacter yeojuensis TaxID=345309 RepID=A0A7X5QVK0_9GAMM|nr:hypothetical protein [Luteibacter yeojuensis]NID16095.1 hypothetical protein [Luteibacter yeojuensis]